MDQRTLLRAASGGIAAVVVGSLGPWATFLGFSIAGTDTDGVYTLGFGAIAGLALWRAWTVDTSGMAAGCAALSIIVFAAAAYNFQHIGRGADGSDLDDGTLSGSIAANVVDSVSIGWGLYLVLFGSAVATAAATGLWRARR